MPQKPAEQFGRRISSLKGPGTKALFDVIIAARDPEGTGIEFCIASGHKEKHIHESSFPMTLHVAIRIHILRIVLHLLKTPLPRNRIRRSEVTFLVLMLKPQPRRQRIHPVQIQVGPFQRVHNLDLPVIMGTPDRSSRSRNTTPRSSAWTRGRRFCTSVNSMW